MADECDFRALLRCGRRYSLADQTWINGKLLADMSIAIDDLVLAGGGGGSSEAAIAATPIETEVAFGAITGAYAVALNDVHDKRRTSIYNRTDADLFFSYNGVATHEIVPAGGSLTIDWKALDLVLDTQIWVKHDGTNAPTQGTLYISGAY